MRPLIEFMNEALEGSFDISFILPAIQSKLDEYVKGLAKQYPKLKKLKLEPLQPVLQRKVDAEARGKNIGNPLFVGFLLRSDFEWDDSLAGLRKEGYTTYDEKIEVGDLEIKFTPSVPAPADKEGTVDVYGSFKYKPNAKGKRLGATQGTGMMDLLKHEITVNADVVCTNVKAHGILVQGVVAKIGGEKITVKSVQGETLIVNPESCLVLTPDMLKK